MSALRYEDNVGLIHFQAKQGFKWAHNAGSGLDYEDMFQIASTAFWIAAQGYNPESGHKFSAYFTQVAFSEFRREIGIMTGVKNLNEGQRAEIAARKEENKRRRETGQPELPEVNYGLAPVSFSELTAPGEEDVAMPFEASLASEGMTPRRTGGASPDLGARGSWSVASGPSDCGLAARPTGSAAARDYRTACPCQPLQRSGAPRRSWAA